MNDLIRYYIDKDENVYLNADDLVDSISKAIPIANDAQRNVLKGVIDAIGAQAQLSLYTERSKLN